MPCIDSFSPSFLKLFHKCSKQSCIGRHLEWFQYLFLFKTMTLEQRLENSGPRARFDLLLVLVNTVLLEYSTHLFTTVVVLVCCDKDHCTHKAKNAYYLKLYRKSVLILASEEAKTTERGRQGRRRERGRERGWELENCYLEFPFLLPSKFY